jgi:hypothetical protein
MANTGQDRTDRDPHSCGLCFLDNVAQPRGIGVTGYHSRGFDPIVFWFVYFRFLFCYEDLLCCPSRFQTQILLLWSP